jgi:hypothetical protein
LPRNGAVGFIDWLGFANIAGVFFGFDYGAGYIEDANAYPHSRQMV